jgi:tripartite-type tricarboxylate transporter receptor subunit TctC
MKIFHALLFTLFLTPLAAAQDGQYPSRPIRLIVPFTPGAGADIAARFFGKQLSAELGQTVVVDNRPGAFGAIAANLVKEADADGYTIFLGSNSPMTVNPVVLKNLSYDPVRDFKPISGLSRNTNVIVVPATSKLKTIDDLVATAKKAPKALNAGTPASGYHLVMEWFASTAGVQFNHIPYKGGASCYTDLVGGQLDLAVGELAGTATFIRSGKMRLLAVSTKERHPEFPDVPAVNERFPGFDSFSWNALFVRTATSDAVTRKLADSMQKILASESAKEFVTRVGTQLLPLGPEAMRKFQLAEIERFQRIANAAGIKPQ